MTRRSSWWWFLSGAALGAVAGVLLAPAEGERTRERLSEEARRLSRRKEVERLREKAGDIVRTVREVARTGGEVIQEGREKIRTYIRPAPPDSAEPLAEPPPAPPAEANDEIRPS